MVHASYPLVNKLVDPENQPFLVETNLPNPMTARVYVNLLEGNKWVITPDINGPTIFTPLVTGAITTFFQWDEPPSNWKNKLENPSFITLWQ